MQSLNSLQKPKKSTRKNEIWRFQFIGCERVRRRDAQGLGVATPRHGFAVKRVDHAFYQCNQIAPRVTHWLV